MILINLIYISHQITNRISAFRTDHVFVKDLQFHKKLQIPDNLATDIKYAKLVHNI